MPIYEFRCNACEVEFEKLVFSSTSSISCSGCGSQDVKRKPSAFGTGGTEKKVSGRSSCSSCSSGACSSCSSH